MTFPRIASFKNYAAFTHHLGNLSVPLPCAENVENGPDSPLAQSIQVHDFTIGNRFCILPMEGWDGTADGKPSELTRRRWHNFGRSGAKLIWGGEAVAVRHDGRANPNQLVINSKNLSDLESLRIELVTAHEAEFGTSADLVVGLQLTHAGRFAKPDCHERMQPRTAQRNSILDARCGITDDSAVVSDEDLTALIEDFIRPTLRSKQAFNSLTLNTATDTSAMNCLAALIGLENLEATLRIAHVFFEKSLRASAVRHPL